MRNRGGGTDLGPEYRLSPDGMVWRKLVKFIGVRSEAEVIPPGTYGSKAISHNFVSFCFLATTIVLKPSGFSVLPFLIPHLFVRTGPGGNSSTPPQYVCFVRHIASSLLTCSSCVIRYILGRTNVWDHVTIKKTTTKKAVKWVKWSLNRKM